MSTEHRALSEETILSLSYKEAAEFKLLSIEEEISLGERIQAALVAGTMDIEARDKLVTHNLRYMRTVAKEFENSGVPLSDLLQEGAIGLIKAAERFDPRRGFRFISYAKWWIVAYVRAGLAEYGKIVHLPGNLKSFKSKIGKAYYELHHKLERDPTIEELAAWTSMDYEEVVEKFGLVYFTTHSLDELLENESSLTLLSVLSDHSSFNPESRIIAEEEFARLILLIQHNLDKLIFCSELEQKIFIMRYGFDGTFIKRTYKEIARSLAVSGKVWSGEYIRQKLEKIWSRTQRRDLFSFSKNEELICHDLILDLIERLNHFMILIGLNLDKNIFLLPDINPEQKQPKHSVDAILNYQNIFILPRPKRGYPVGRPRRVRPTIAMLRAGIAKLKQGTKK